MILIDPAITESSAWVALADGNFVTTNDSGDTGRVFTVDRNGKTIGVTYWEKSPTDVEALALADADHVWVGDIGDNNANRPYLEVADVPVDTTGTTSYHPQIYKLAYPDGKHDAETLLCDPATGRLYIVTKEFFTGQIYEAPATLDPHGVNMLTAIGYVMPIATDGAFLDAKHIVIRGYQTATVYTWPGLARVAAFELPQQPQGEGIGVDATGTIWLSSEGLHSKILSMQLPAAVKAAIAKGQQTAKLPDTNGRWPWLSWSFGFVALAVFFYVVVRTARWRRVRRRL